MIPIPLVSALPWRLIGAVIACAGLFGAGAYAEHWRASRAAAIEEAEELAQALESAQEAQRITARLNAKSQEVQDAYAARNRTLAAAADGARTERDGLRSDLATITASRPAPASGQLVAGSDTITVVVNECADVVQTMARTLDDRESTLKALQDWVKGTGAPDGRPRGDR